DTHPRLTCPECDFVHYNNPKPVAVAIVADDAGRILMCRRAIDPRKGYWTLPGGFMERGETLQEGAARETLEEAGATIDVGALIAIFQTPDKSVIMFFFR